MSERQRAYNAVAQLELMPHGATTSWDSAGRGKPESRPPGGGVGHEEGEYAQLSHASFRRRLLKAHTARDFRAIADAAEAALEAWRRTPEIDLVLERTDAHGHYTFWLKRLVANSDESPTELARLYGVSRQTVYTWRAKYRAPFRRAA